jgi:streptogramin lyase
LGDCANLSSSTFIWVNELTTVASVYSLAPFMVVNSANPGAGVATSTSTAGAQGLENAFATVNNLTNTAKGTVPGPALPAGATVPVAEIDTLANILATCVNSADIVAGVTPSANCTTLFTDATPSGGSAPANTIDALLDIAHNPGNNASTLYALSTGMTPFGNNLASAPNDWTLAVNYTGNGLSFPLFVTVDGMGQVWVSNLGGNSVSSFSPTGAARFSTSNGGVNTPYGIALDTSNDMWVADNRGSGGGAVAEVDSNGNALNGSPFVPPIGGISSPVAMAVDGLGNIWAANSDTYSLVKLTSVGGALSPDTTGYEVSMSLNSPTAIAVAPTLPGAPPTPGNVWVTSENNSSLVEVNVNDGSLIQSLSSNFLSTPLALGIDASGNIWVSDPSGDVSEFHSDGTYDARGINDPIGLGVVLAAYSLSIDGAGNVWFPDHDHNVVNEVDNNGNLVSPNPYSVPPSGNTGYQFGTGALNSAYGLAVDGSGNVWVTNAGNNSLTELVGAAAPVVTPIATGVANNTLGTRP